MSTNSFGNNKKYCPVKCEINIEIMRVGGLLLFLSVFICFICIRDVHASPKYVYHLVKDGCHWFSYFFITKTGIFPWFYLFACENDQFHTKFMELIIKCSHRYASISVQKLWLSWEKYLFRENFHFELKVW